ncbi:MAG: hydroxyisourate hydrolase [Euzebyales bacterium]|nr:hydroxyisourate hydrolase [Euzebyales bacterium]
MSISTHVLDTARGRPAAGVGVVLEQRGDDGGWERLGGGVTDDDGRLTDLLGQAAARAGTYRLTFDTGAYLEGFYPEVNVTFTVTDPARHHHVPLLLSPYGYTTYRGS